VRRAISLLWRGTVYGLAVLLAGSILVQAWFFAHILYWAKHNPDSTRTMDIRLAALREKNPAAGLKHIWIDYGRASTHLKRAIIAAEDAKFVGHEGFDWEGMQRALEKNQRRGKVVAGGSTITQQLAKNLFLTGERSLLRKAQEAIITAMLEIALDKRRILEIYLNVVEWGEGVFGAEAAARHYYAVSAAALSPEQAARLAAMLPRPRFYDRNRDSPYLAQYADTILTRMGSVQVP
jgi:monofunctional biosynthetic peptidoglycan transglycosylase